MPIVGFNFTKMNIERKDKFNNDKINSNLNITHVEQEQLTIGPSEEILKFIFEFSVNYGTAGDTLLEGHVLYMDSPEKIKEYLSSWEKDKSIPTDIMSQILNTILFKCNVKALNLSQEVNLPPHIQLPRVKPNKN